GSVFSRRLASQPSKSGNSMSIRIMSGRWACAFSNASVPDVAMTTSNCRFFSRRDSISMFSSLSSTSRTRGMCLPPLLEIIGARYLANSLLHLPDNIFRRGRALLQNFLYRALKPEPVGGVEVAGRDHYDGYLPPLG